MTYGAIPSGDVLLFRVQPQNTPPEEILHASIHDRGVRQLMETHESLYNTAITLMADYQDYEDYEEPAPAELTHFRVHFRPFAGQMLSTRASATVSGTTWSEVFITNDVRSWPDRETWRAEQKMHLMRKCFIKWVVFADKLQIKRKFFVDWCVTTSPIKFLQYYGPKEQDPQAPMYLAKRARVTLAECRGRDTDPHEIAQCFAIAEFRAENWLGTLSEDDKKQYKAFIEHNRVHDRIVAKTVEMIREYRTLMDR
jgi:hypothetical protein